MTTRPITPHISVPRSDDTIVAEWLALAFALVERGLPSVRGLVGRDGLDCGCNGDRQSRHGLLDSVPVSLSDWLPDHGVPRPPTLMSSNGSSPRERGWVPIHILRIPAAVRVKEDRRPCEILTPGQRNRRATTQATRPTNKSAEHDAPYLAAVATYVLSAAHRAELWTDSPGAPLGTCY